MVRPDFSKMTKFDLKMWLERHGHEYYVNPDHFTKSELVDWCEEKFHMFYE